MEQRIQFFKNLKDKLNSVGSGFCTMKWLHQTLYLHTGDNHSCYHPKPHHIDLEEINIDPSSLHNTSWKKQQRKDMLEGKRPEECSYCWNIEDLPGRHASDRLLYSARDWAIEEIDNIASKPWDEHVNPKFLEVSFGNNCNFRCGYCGPHASTMWVEELKKHGHYNITNSNLNIDFLDNSTYYGPKDNNPYVEAFWKWWPELRKDLRILRITGGEPLMNPATMELLNVLDKEPTPNLTLSINTNLGVSFDRVKKTINQVEKLITEKKILDIIVYTSIDTWGPKAEYIRTGLDCSHWERNMLEVLRGCKHIRFMCTFNILCVTNYQSLLKKIIEWRKTFGKESFVIDIPSLVEPAYWNINILTPNFMVYMDDTIKFMEENSEWFENIEIHKFKRVTELMRTPNISAEKIMQGRREFYAFFTENDKRLGTNLLDTFPEYKDFYQLCKETYESF